ncbi:MAG: CoA transferase subunit A [Candidatus Rokubacteria bacterium]|nr:CoA transferase subunit A [Candidatus Rokubacteria bacterium]
MPPSRLMPLREAVHRFVPDGTSVCMGTALEALIPFAAGHELIRQRRRDLTLIGPISDMLFDQLVGAGAVARIIAAWVGNVSAGLGHNYRRAVERGVPRPLAVEDHSNLTLATALQAAAMGAPYIPTRSLLGTDLPRSNGRLREAVDPWSGTPLLLVPALAPDVAILHVQRADAEGHAHVWGTLGVTREAALAARRVILVAEEILSREAILSDPGLVLVPEFKVAAVVHEPLGAYPSPVQGHYRRDHAFYQRFHDESRSEDGMRAWLERWVHGVADWPGFLGLVGPGTLDAIRISRPLPSLPLDYGS